MALLQLVSGVNGHHAVLYNAVPVAGELFLLSAALITVVLDRFRAGRLTNVVLRVAALRIGD